jgi:hypothetical protein
VDVTNPSMTIARAGGEIVISWEGQGMALETTDRIGGAWTAVPNAASPYRPGVSDATRFFRLRQAQ